jgi:hypothetical protein
MTIPVTPVPPVKHLDRPSIVAAFADYLREVNAGDDHPDPEKALFVWESNRKAGLRKAGLPVRGEVYYLIKRDLFPVAETTRLEAGETPEALAETLVGQIWEKLRIWNAYDFALSTSACTPGRRPEPLPIACPDRPPATACTRRGWDGRNTGFLQRRADRIARQEGLEGRQDVGQ